RINRGHYVSDSCKTTSDRPTANPPARCDGIEPRRASVERNRADGAAAGIERRKRDGRGGPPHLHGAVPATGCDEIPTKPQTRRGIAVELRQRIRCELLSMRISRLRLFAAAFDQGEHRYSRDDEERNERGRCNDERSSPPPLRFPQRTLRLMARAPGEHGV